MQALTSLLLNRYKNCKIGHLKPDKDSNKCNYCHKTLEYRMEDIDEALEKRTGRIIWPIPFDEDKVRLMRRAELSKRRHEDFNYGLRKLAEEFKFI